MTGDGSPCLLRNPQPKPADRHFGLSAGFFALLSANGGVDEIFPQNNYRTIYFGEIYEIIDI